MWPNRSLHSAPPRGRPAAAWSGARSALLGLGLAILVVAVPSAARAGNAVDLTASVASSSAQHFSAGSQVIPTSGSYTVEAWLYATSTSDQIIIGQSSGYFIGIRDASDSFWIGDQWVTGAPPPARRARPWPGGRGA